MAQELNRYGQCPNCECGWDGGDILDALSNLDIFKAKTPNEVLSMASQCYGYTLENKPRFTRLVSIETMGLPQNRAFWQCPVCHHVWDKFTWEHWNNIKSALRADSIAHSDKLLGDILSKQDEDDDCPFD